jgi:hypothetical protein
LGNQYISFGHSFSEKPKNVQGQQVLLLAMQDYFQDVGEQLQTPQSDKKYETNPHEA